MKKYKPRAKPLFGFVQFLTAYGYPISRSLEKSLDVRGIDGFHIIAIYRKHYEEIAQALESEEAIEPYSEKDIKGFKSQLIEALKPPDLTFIEASKRLKKYLRTRHWVFKGGYGYKMTSRGKDVIFFHANKYILVGEGYPTIARSKENARLLTNQNIKTLKNQEIESLLVQYFR